MINNPGIGRDIFDVFSRKNISVLSFDTFKNIPKSLQKEAQKKEREGDLCSVRVSFLLESISDLSMIIEKIEEQQHILFVAIY